MVRKTTLEFVLPDEQERLETYLNAPAMEERLKDFRKFLEEPFLKEDKHGLSIVIEKFDAIFKSLLH